MIRALIIDDEPLSRERVRALLDARPDIEVISECQDGEEAVRAILTHNPELIFLDIQMPEMDGFEVVVSLPQERLPAIIFITAFDEYAIRAFEVNAIDYLLKPINAARFEKAVSRAVEMISASGSNQLDRKLSDFVESMRAERGYTKRFVVWSGAKWFFVQTGDVDWIDSEGNYVRLHVSGKEHLVRDTIKSVESRLDPDTFLRVHRSIIINLDRVVSVEPYFHGEYVVTMCDGAKLTTSRSRSNRLRAFLH